jgi:retron-type reverse transcriptase
MDKTYTPANLASSFEKVWPNGGSAGAAAQTVAHFARHAEEELPRLSEQMRGGTHRPQPVRQAWIPKPGSRERRPLGIPAVRDRIVPGALRRVDPLLKAGHVWVVDADLKSCFDRVNHDLLMHRLGHTIRDKRVLRLFGNYLRAGVMIEGVVQASEEGTPQGGPLSPREIGFRLAGEGARVLLSRGELLLASIYLAALDRELESRGLAFSRYADDCNIYVSSPPAAERVLASLSEWIQQHLRLEVHATKSGVGRP